MEEINYNNAKSKYSTKETYYSTKETNHVTEETNHLQTNVLVIGKSGVGKSSLLNYIFGEEVEKTGSGKPVTEEGIYKHTYKRNDHFYINIYDTWGLEANKATEWKELIIEEVKSHDYLNINEWFHTILYCFSAKTARIEDFELSIIKELMESGNRIVVVLTHCDTNNISNSIIQMEKVLNGVGVSSESIVQVCSVYKTLLGGKKSEPFGNEKLIEMIKKNLWTTISVKVPCRIRDMGNYYIKEWKNNCITYIDNKLTILNYHSNTTFKKFNKYCNDELNHVFNEINHFYGEQVYDSMLYYNRISEQLFLITGKEVKKPYIDTKFKVNFSMDFSEKVIENIVSVLMGFIPVLNFLVPTVMRDMKKDELKNAVVSIEHNVRLKLEEETEKVENMLKSWKN